MRGGVKIDTQHGSEDLKGPMLQLCFFLCHLREGGADY